jgi:hypothetical protein
MVDLKCKYCNSNAEIKGFRNFHGQVSSELVCKACNLLSSDYLLERDTPPLTEVNTGGLLRMFNEIWDKWSDVGTLDHLTDFEEIVRELQKREY